MLLQRLLLEFLQRLAARIFTAFSPEILSGASIGIIFKAIL